MKGGRERHSSKLSQKGDLPVMRRLKKQNKTLEPVPGPGTEQIRTLGLARPSLVLFSRTTVPLPCGGDFLRVQHFQLSRALRLGS